MPSVPRLGLVWGPGLPEAQAARPSFRIRDSCPPGLFWEAAQLRSTPAFLRGISHHSEAVCTPGPRLPAPSQACLSSRSATVIILLPTSPATPAGVRLPGVEGVGGRGVWPVRLPGLLCDSHCLHRLPAPAGTPRHPPCVARAPPPSSSPQGSSLCES